MISQASTTSVNSTISQKAEVVQDMYTDYLTTWTRPLMNGQAPSGRGGHSSVLADNKLVIFGGHFYGGNNTFEYLNSVFVLDLETSTWHEVNCHGNVPPPRYFHSATVIGNRMFIFGGKGPDGNLYKTMYFLDLEEWCWYPVHWTTESPSARFHHAHVAVGTKLVIFGGWDGKVSNRELWVFDTDSFTWMKPQTADKPPTARHGHTMSLLDDGRILVFGGYSVANAAKMDRIQPVYHSDLYVLDTQTMIWSRPRVTGAYPKPRFGHAVSLSGDMLFVVGGWSGTEKSLISIGDKVLRSQAKQKAREERLQAGYTPESTIPKNLRGTSGAYHILNTTTMHWETPPSVGAQVVNRYGHTCNLVGPHLFVFGGWDGSRAVNELYVAELPIQE